MSRTHQASEAQPLLTHLITINQSGVRSINIERDLSHSRLVERYILTTQSRLTLDRILSGYCDSSPRRAWTLTGPYGSGKSFFSLFLMNLACTTQSAHKETIERLRETDPILAEQACNLLGLSTGKGLLPVAVTGFRAPILECLRQGIKKTIKASGISEQVAEELAALEAWGDQTNTRTVVAWFEKLLAKLSKLRTGYQGIILIFDEMGKPLEYAAAHPDKADVFLLQELAEFANRSGETPLLFVGVLHQSFERYASLLDVRTQQEWAKVQGRFEDVAFQESPALQIRLLAKAIEANDTAQLAVARPLLKQATREAIECGWCPPLMSESEFERLCHNSYPLHPTTLVALPFLFRRLAQNERSIFAYLASGEPFSFQEFLQQHRVPAFVRLPDLFDYLMANLRGRLSATGRGRVLQEAQERLQSTAQLNALEQETIKTIGLLNWLSEISSLQASTATLLLALRTEKHTEEKVLEVLRSLQERSLIVYRRFNGTYSVWQGSDVDLEEQLHKAQQKVAGTFSVAESLQRYLPPRPIVARRHSYETGTLRYFDVEYVDAIRRDTLSLTPRGGASGKILLCIPSNPTEIEDFEAWVTSGAFQKVPNVVAGVVTQAMRLTELLQELRYLHWVRENTPELRDDAVARRELRLRIAAVGSLINGELDRSFSLHQLSASSGCQWFHKGSQLESMGKKGLSHTLSGICDQLYAQTPTLWNELINRESLSSQGVAARRKLIEAMLTDSDQELLGISGYPPERSMYESILRASGLHAEVAPGEWGFQTLPKEDPLNLRAVWKALGDYVFADPPEPRPIDELFNLLRRPPYGLTEGVSPVLLCAFLIVHQKETTLYREKTLLPDPGIADWEVMLRRPELFQVAGYRITGNLAAIVKRFAQGLGTEAAVMPVVRDLMRRFKSLPEHTWKTQAVSERARALRHAISNARSPEQLLFRSIPEALDLPRFTAESVTEEKTELYFSRLNEVMAELANNISCLQIRARDQFLAASGFEPGDSGWQQFLILADEIADRVVNPNLGPLLRRAANAHDPQSALENVLAVVAGRPPRSWSDADVVRFKTQAQFMGQLLQAEKNGTAPTVRLSEYERRRSQEIIEEIRSQLREQYDAAEWPLLQVALQLLAQESQSKLTDEPF